MDLRYGTLNTEGGSVRAIPASARIQAALRDQIVSMQLMPSTPLTEKDIADQYGVSRTPVREALLRLSEERLVDIYPQYGTFVSRIRPDALRDAMVIREALERVAVREAANKATPSDIVDLGRIIDLQRARDEAGDLAAFHAADEDFHQAIAAVAGHPNLWRVVKREKTEVDRCRMLTLPLPGRRRVVVSQHVAIMDAVASRDPDAAERAMSAHLADVLPSFERVQEAHPDYFEGNGPHAAAPPRRMAAGRS
jgi:GntR family transcriptional regulator, rspAB operon transcriptional repressor